MTTAGIRIGRYEVGERLGKGGFGVVHLARDVELGREVAIKFLRPEYMTRRQVVQRFLQEARACAKIGHPGIVTVFECGLVEGSGQRLDGTAYLVMERLRGESLGDRLQHRGRMPALAAIGIARQLAAALHVAHDAGIIHRDLKPDNVYLVKDAAVVGGERVKILDFGVAKLTDPEPDEDPNTHSQMMLGTPRYMSPEQARAAAKVDHRTDIYALGCLLYELVCGKPPFGGDIGEVLVSHQTAPITPPREIVPSIPAALDELIVRMLAKEPEARPASMRAVDDSLDEVFGSLAPKRRAKTSPDEEKTVPRKPLVPDTDEPTFRLKPSDDTEEDDHTTRRLAEPAHQVELVTPVHMKATLIQPPPITEPMTAASPWWRWRYAIGVGAALLSALVMYLALRKPAQAREEPAKVDSRVVVTPDAAIVEPDAAIVQVPADAADNLTVKKLTTACATAAFEKKWGQLEECGHQLEAMQVPEGSELVKRAAEEARAEVRYRVLEEALGARDLAAATEALAMIDDTSVYYKPAQAAYTAAKGPVIDALVAELNAIAAARDCAKHTQRLRAIDTKHGKQIADETKLMARPCTRAGTIAPVTNALPTPLDACDKDSVDEEDRRGDANLTAGNFAAALVAFEKVVKCRPDVARKAYLAACRARNFPKAKQYFALARNQNIAQICLKEGFDPR